MPVNDLLTLADIRQYTFYLLEQEGGTGSDFWTNDIIDAFISSEHRKLTTVVNEAYEEFFTNQATTDIVAGQDLYGLPDDFRKMIRMEWSPTPGTASFREIIPKQINEQSEFWLADGTTPSGDGRVHRVSYAFLNTQFRLVPHFNAAVVAGLQMCYTQRLPAPALESWEPFNGLLKDHHELIAVGAAIRGKIREEVDFSGLASLYGELKRELVLDIEQRQVQRTRIVRESEGLYDTF